MAHEIEPMDIDVSVCDFDDKENSFHHNNVPPRTPCTEKGYEELDVSELNMKLRYSVTPIASPMSKSYTANCSENRNYDNENTCGSENGNLTRSLHSTLNKNDILVKSQKLLPLQSLSMDPSQVGDGNWNVLRPLDSTVTSENVTVTVTGPGDVDDNLSLPSSSSSLPHTPEATTPTIDIPKSDGSPIMRGLKSVLSMFRPSQSPIPPVEEDVQVKEEAISPPIVHSPRTSDSVEVVQASTPLTAHKTKEFLTKRNSSHSDSLVFNEDLEKELEWKDDSTIIFGKEKIPIHKLFFQLPKSESKANPNVTNILNETQKLSGAHDATVEYMDISYNDSGLADKTAAKTLEPQNVSEVLESDGEFVDAESTFKSEPEFEQSENRELITENDTNDMKPQDVNASIETIHVSHSKSEDGNCSSTNTTKLNITASHEDNFILNEHIHRENQLEGQMTEHKKHVGPNLSEQVGKVENVDTVSLSNVVKDFDDKTSPDSHISFDDNHINSPSMSNSSVVDSLSLIPLIADPRVLLFNVPVDKPSETTDYIESKKPHDFSSPADIPLPDDDDMASLPSMNCALDNISHTLDKISQEIPKLNQQKELETSSNERMSETSDSIVSEEKGNNYDYKEVKQIEVSDNNRSMNEPIVLSTKPIAPEISELQENQSANNLPENLKSNEIEQLSLTDIQNTNIEVYVLANVNNEISCHERVDGEITIKTCDQKTDHIIDSSEDTKPSEILTTDVKNADLEEKSLEIKNTCSSEVADEQVKISVQNTENRFDEKQVHINDLNTKNPSVEFDQSSVEFIKQEIETIIDQAVAILSEKISVSCISPENDFALMNEEQKQIDENIIDKVNIKEAIDNPPFKIDPQHLTKAPDMIVNDTGSNTINSEEIELPATQSSVECLQNENASLKEVENRFKNASDAHFKDENLKLTPFESGTDSEEALNKSTSQYDSKSIDIKNGNFILEYISSDNIDLVQQTTLNEDKKEIKSEVTVTDNNKSVAIVIESVENKKQDMTPESNTKKIHIEERASKNNVNTEVAEEKSVAVISLDMENVIKPSLLTEDILSSDKNTTALTAQKEVDVETFSSENVNNVENPFAIKSKMTITPPSSPKIQSKGYNFNFDEIEDPFATKSRDVETFSSENVNNVENPFAIKSKMTITPPSSPKIQSKGYNFNFDEIEDPFATKSRISLSPLPGKLSDHSFVNINTDKVLENKSYKKKRRQSGTENKKPIQKKLTSSFSEKSRVKPDPKETQSAAPDLTEASSSDPMVCTNEKAVVLHEPTKLDSEEDLNKNQNKIEMNTVKDDNVVTSSLEKSDHYSTATSSNENLDSKSNNELPEFDDSNINPFATKSKVCQSPLPEDAEFNPFVTRSRVCQTPPLVDHENLKHPCENDQDLNKQEADKNKNFNAKTKKDDLINANSAENYNLSFATSSSKNDHNISSKTIHTEDEDTIEGPFLEAEDLISDDKMSDFGEDNDDMMQFSELPLRNEDNGEAGEMFIDADAFEFLLNQNKANAMTDSGKESLFLKFDPLFAKRVSSDGVLAALCEVQTKQSTPKKIERPPLLRDATFGKCPSLKPENEPSSITPKNNEKPAIQSDATFDISPVTERNQVTPKNSEEHPLLKDATFDKSPMPGPSQLSQTLDMDSHNTTEESCDDFNVTVSKPMMVVNPAVNPVVTPRNKSMTPVRSNRQSLTFTSPAIAVIDRLLSMSSANNSFMAHDTTVAEVRRDNEADLALTQLRELLADKEISVFNLRSETKDLKKRLETMESQMKNLETIGEERLKKINELNEKLNEKTQHNKSMAKVVEEYERTIASLISETEQDRRRHAKERMQLIRERDEQTAHLASMEISFNDLHSKYEKSKQVIMSFKDNEDMYKKSIKEFEDNLTKMQKNYELLKQHATSKLNYANEELQKINRAHEAEVLKLNALIKRKDLHITSLEETLQQKTKANEELTAICDELINKVG